MAAVTAYRAYSAINNTGIRSGRLLCAHQLYRPREVSVAALKGLHFAHVHNVPFENLDIHLGRQLSLQPADLFSKIVNHKRGGYCYEVNSFFTMVLRAFGFRVQGLLARALCSFSDFRPRSHQLLLVTVDNEHWIADVGFGSCCLREPLRLTAGVVNEQGPDSFRLRAEPGPTYILETYLTGRWQDLYAFTLEPFDLCPLRTVQLLELDFAPSPLDAAESLHDPDKRRTHRCSG